MDVIENKAGLLKNLGKQFETLRQKDEKGIGPYFAKRQNEFYPPDSPYSYGMSARLVSSDIPPPGFYQQLASYHPDGYIVGVGAGAIFTFIQAFSAEHSPKGIVICDKQPEVIPFARMLVGAFDQLSTEAVMRKNFFEVSDQEFLKRLHKTVDKENPIIKKRYKKLKATRFLYEEKPLVVYREGPSDKTDVQVEGLLDLPRFVLENFDILHALAQEKNIAIAFADFTDPKFIANVKGLPGFMDSTNIIYSSNISSVGGDVSVDNLREYEHGSKNNIFIDSDSDKLAHGCQMRASTKVMLSRS